MVLFPLLPSAALSVWMMCGCVQVQMCIQEARGQPSVLLLMCHLPWLRGNLSLAWVSLIQLDFLASEPQHPSVSVSPALELQMGTTKPSFGFVCLFLFVFFFPALVF